MLFHHISKSSDVHSCSNLFGYLFPAYLSFKALRSRDGGQVTVLLVYWLVIGLFSVIESFADTFVFW